LASSIYFSKDNECSTCLFEFFACLLDFLLFPVQNLTLLKLTFKFLGLLGVGLSHLLDFSALIEVGILFFDLVVLSLAKIAVSSPISPIVTSVIVLVPVAVMIPVAISVCPVWSVPITSVAPVRAFDSFVSFWAFPVAIVVLAFLFFVLVAVPVVFMLFFVLFVLGAVSGA
jgi:hypothetical protein